VLATPREPQLEDLAYHFSEAGEWAKALPYAEQAAVQAEALYAPASGLRAVLPRN
jgi:hypothetical protein